MGHRSPAIENHRIGQASLAIAQLLHCIHDLGLGNQEGVVDLQLFCELDDFRRIIDADPYKL